MVYVSIVYTSLFSIAVVDIYYSFCTSLYS